jgi:hypothetical protein
MTLLAPNIHKEWALPDDIDNTDQITMGSNPLSQTTSVDPSHPTQLIKKANNDAPANILPHNKLGDIDDSDDSDLDFGLLLQEQSDGEDKEDDKDEDDGSRSTNKALRTPLPKKTILIINHYKDWDNGEPLSPEGCKHILSMGSDYEQAQAMNKRCNQHKLQELEVKNGIGDLFKMNKDKSKAETKTKVKSNPTNPTAATTLIC